MRLDKIWTALALLATGLALSACAETNATPASEESAAIVRPLSNGSGLSTVTLVGQASERLGIETAPVVASTAGSGRTVIPYSAVIYDPAGGTWAYTETEAGTYLRDEIEVSRITGARAVLTKGPKGGTPVVTVGAAELYGAEVGVDH